MPSPRTREPVFLDTNVIVYAMGRSPQAAPATRALETACRRIVAALGQGELEAVTSLVVLQELIYLLARWRRAGRGPGLPAPQRVVRNVVGLCREVFTPTLAELQQALRGYASHRHDFNDRLIVQAMRARGIARIVTADRDFERTREIRRVDPVALAAQLD